MSTVVIQRVLESDNYVWDPNTMMWVKETQPSGGGGGGGAVTVADGADTAEGTTTDVAVQGDNPGTLSAKLRGLNKSVAAGLPITNANLDSPLSGIKSDLDEIAVDTDNLALIKAKTDNIDVALSTRTKPSDQQHVIVDTPTSFSVLDATATGTLANLGDVISIPLSGYQGASINIASGLNAIIGTDFSYDGGVTWIAGLFYVPAVTSAPTIQPLITLSGMFNATLCFAGGASHVRVRVVNFTSGSAAAVLRTTAAASPHLDLPMVVDGQGQPLGSANTGVAISGWDTVATQAHRILTDSLGRLIVGGPATSGGTNVGNPVKMGGAFNTTPPTFVTGKIGDIQIDARGAVQVVQGANGTFALEAGGHLATIDGNTAPLLVAAAGGYVRQDSTATIALESGGNLAAIKADVDKIPSQGAAVTAASMPVNIASDQVVPVSATALPLPANAAKESGGNLATIAANTTGLAVETGGRLEQIAQWDRVRNVIAQNHLLATLAQPPNGFVPTETPSFLVG